MEFPHNRHTHHHHHHRGDDDYEEERKREYYPPPGTFHPDQPPHYPPQSEFVPPPSGYYQDENFAPPPPPPSIPTSYVEEVEYGAPPPPRVGVIHVSHEQRETLHSFQPHLPSFGHHQYGSESGTGLSNKPSVRIYSKAEPNFGLTIRDGKVILAPSDPSDDFQKWYKDEKYSTRVKDEEGCPCFSLVNKVTGEAIKHSIGDTHPVQLVRYNPDYLDESVLWTESKDLGDGYRAIRMVNNIHLNVDAFHGDKHSGGVHEGTIIVLWKWNKGDNQRWKIAPNCGRNKFPRVHPIRLVCHSCQHLSKRCGINNHAVFGIYISLWYVTDLSVSCFIECTLMFVKSCEFFMNVEKE